MWMDDGTGEYTKDGSSKYTEVLDALIGAFVDAHPQIDRSRIYIGGCSNGGFMTMKQIIFNPSRYAAAYPVCEALADAFISDEDILKLKDLPIWFTHAKPTPLSFRMTLSFRPMSVWQRSTRMHTSPTGTRYSITPEHRKMQMAPHSNTSATGPGSRC